MAETEKILLLTGSGFSISFLKNENNETLSTQFLTDLLTRREQFEKYLELLIEDVSDKEKERLKFIPIQKKCSLVFNLLNLEYINNKDENITFNFEHILFALECICGLSKIHTKLLPQNLENYIKTAVLSSSIKFEYAELNALYLFLADVVCLFERENRKAEKAGTPESTNLECITKFKKVLNNQETKHFTLNYDTCFYDSKLLFDFNEKSQEIVENIYPKIKNYHLHGSILNYRDGVNIGRHRTASNARKARISFQIPSEPSNNNTSYFNYEYSNSDNGYLFPIITGLSKSIKLLNSSYDWLYQQFILSAYEATYLIIIGYSFNDPHINSVLKYVIENEKLKKIDIVGFTKDKQNLVEEIKEKIMPSDNQLAEVSNKLLFHIDGAEEFMNNFKLV